MQGGSSLVVAILRNIWFGRPLPLSLSDALLLYEFRITKLVSVLLYIYIRTNCFILFLCGNWYHWILCVLLVHKNCLLLCEI